MNVDLGVIKAFMRQRRQPIHRPPRVHGKEVELAEFYRLVLSYGGFTAATEGPSCPPLRPLCAPLRGVSHCAERPPKWVRHNSVALGRNRRKAPIGARFRDGFADGV